MLTPSPASFREWVSGTCFASFPPSWKVEVDQTRVTIRPAWKVTIFVALAWLVFFGFAPLAYFTRATDRIGKLVEIFFVGSVLVISLGVLAWFFMLCLRNQLQGPHLVYSTSMQDHRIELPRYALVVPLDDVIRWRVVSGNWVGPQGMQKRQDSAITELQLIVKSLHGLMAYPVVAGYTATIDDLLQQVFKSIPLPVEKVEQSQGVTVRSPQEVLKRWDNDGYNNP